MPNLTKSDKEDIISTLTSDLTTVLSDVIDKKIKDMYDDKPNAPSASKNATIESDTFEERIFDLRVGSEKRILEKHVYMSVHREHGINQIDKNHCNYADQSVLRCVLRWISSGQLTNHKRAIAYAASRVGSEWIDNKRKKDSPSLLLTLLGTIDCQFHEDPTKSFDKSEIRDLHSEFRDCVEKPPKYPDPISNYASSKASARFPYHQSQSNPPCFSFNKERGCSYDNCQYQHICYHHYHKNGKKLAHSLQDCEEHNESGCQCEGNMQ